MNILVRLPNWLGDAVMATFALEILLKAFPNAYFYFVGSKVSIALFRHYENITLIEDVTKESKNRFFALYKLAKEIPSCDFAFTLQNNFLSALLLVFNGAKFRVGFSKEMRKILLSYAPKRPKKMHETMRYATLITQALEFKKIAAPKIESKLYLKPSEIAINLPESFKDSKILGINAGAAFGSAKRWSESYFAQTAMYFLRQNYKVILFGVASENAINTAILDAIEKPYIKSVLNLSGKTNLQELMAYFLCLEVLLTNDSGPMHIAVALNVKTLALFGPTRSDETGPFNAPNAEIISLQTFNSPLSCAPCMQRKCPLKEDSKEYHACMKNLTPNLVIPKIQSLISAKKIES